MRESLPAALLCSAGGTTVRKHRTELQPSAACTERVLVLQQFCSTEAGLTTGYYWTDRNTHTLNFDACTPCLTKCRSYRYRYTSGSYTDILHNMLSFASCTSHPAFLLARSQNTLHNGNLIANSKFFLRMDRGEEEPAEQLLWKRAVSLLS